MTDPRHPDAVPLPSAEPDPDPDAWAPDPEELDHLAHLTERPMIRLTPHHRYL